MPNKNEKRPWAEICADSSKQSLPFVRVLDGRNRIARLMREASLCGRQKGRYRVQTTESKHAQPTASNFMAQAPADAGPKQIWVGDITYIETQEGWLYLAAILDRYSRKIVGWAMSARIDTELVLKAFAMALRHRQPTATVLFHSDRGVQYASADYRHALRQAGLVASISRKGNCYDNATMESFWSTLKLELIYRRKFATRSKPAAKSLSTSKAFTIASALIAPWTIVRPLTSKLKTTNQMTQLLCTPYRSKPTRCPARRAPSPARRTNRRTDSVRRY